MEHYFQTYQRYFWQWEEKGEVLAIPQHNSIAYRGYLQQVVHHLSKQGLPPFGSLLLAIIATNKNSEAALNAVAKIVGQSLDKHHNQLLTSSIAFLQILSELPAEYREGHKRILMLQAIFENCHNINSRKVSTESAKQLSEDFFGVHNLTPKSMPGAVLVYRDFRPLELLHARFKTPEDIIQKMASLPSLPEELLLTETQAEQATEEKDLVEQLLLNDKTFFVGSLVKRIWGGLNIPVHSSLPSAQPLGGISDLTNKGDFDKLLISEFANDNLVFLSRLANNEALYIHREIPPEKNNLHRIILIDCSLKNWGTPKTIAFAVMLAIARHPKTDIPCTVYAVGEQYHPIAIDNIHSIIEGLMQLNGQLHAAAGLERFFAEHPAHKQSEVFFITNPSALKHEALLRTLNEYYPRIHYTIYTDAAGNIDVYKKQQGGKKHIQHLLLPLEELWKKEPAPQQPQPQAGMHFTSFPLLFPRTTGIKYQVQLPDNQVLIVNKERQVLRVYDNSPNPEFKGWEMLYGPLPGGATLFEAGTNENGDYIMLCFTPQNRELHLVNISRETQVSVTFSQWRSRAHRNFIFMENRFVHENSTGAWSIYPNGDIVKEQTSYNEWFSQKEQEDKINPAVISSYTRIILKNINTIGINTEKKLVINAHVLCLNNGGHIKMESYGRQQLQCTAQRDGQHEFLFPDGSRVHIHRSGMLILHSSNAAIPDIFIPSILNVALSAATSEYFCGNQFYYKEPLVHLVLKNRGDSPLNTIKHLREVTDISLSEAKKIIDSAPAPVLRFSTELAAQAVKSKLESQGAEAEIQHADKEHRIKQEIISTQRFFSQFVEPFIEHILVNGSRH